MKRVAIFGNAGGGKSTLAKKLATATGLPLYPLDLIQFKAGGDAVPHDDYLKAHADVLRREAWIIDGFGCMESAWQRFEAADTLVHIDLPLPVHYWWVMKRLLKAPVVHPEGWPPGSPLWSSTVDALQVVGKCHRHLTPKYRALVKEAAASKRVHHLRSTHEIRSFLAAVKTQR